jgi:hypothetical protein
LLLRRLFLPTIFCLLIKRYDFMKPNYSDFDGNWDDECFYCGEPHRSHQIDSGVYKGNHLLHRLPCEQEKDEIRFRAFKRGAINKLIITCIDVCTYLWSKIPFKDEAKLLFSVFKRIYITIRAFVYLRMNRVKKHNKKLNKDK